MKIGFWDKMADLEIEWAKSVVLMSSLSITLSGCGHCEACVSVLLRN